MISAEDAIARLRDGNERFVSSQNSAEANTNKKPWSDESAGQSPFAIVLACSDSRVPTELIFDQGIGDLFVVRVAGNIAAPSQIGSIEYAAAVLGTRLVVVLGHSGCGAVTATINALAQNEAVASPNLAAIVDRISPAIQALPGTHEKVDEAEFLARAIRANVHQSVERMRLDSTILEELVTGEKLTVVGAEYSIQSGVVEFFE